MAMTDAEANPMGAASEGSAVAASSSAEDPSRSGILPIDDPQREISMGAGGRSGRGATLKGTSRA